MNRILAGTLIAMCLTGSFSYHGREDFYEAHATAYCLQGITASGKEVREGICATGHEEWLGKTCVVYQRLPDGSVGEIIGIYEIEDTGCKERVIDVWQPNLEKCQEFMDRVYENDCKGRVWLQIIDAKG